MNRVVVFRLLLVLYVLCYAEALRFQGLDYAHSSSALQEYQELLDARFGGFRENVWRCIELWLAGHLIEVAGLVLLFCRVRRGLWLACLGAALAAGASWFISQPDFYPNLRTSTDQVFWSATGILWGSCVCMALTDQRNVFRGHDQVLNASLD